MGSQVVDVARGSKSRIHKVTPSECLQHLVSYGYVPKSEDFSPFYDPLFIDYIYQVC